MMVNTPTNAKVMETFYQYSTQRYLGCLRHGGGWYLLAFSVGARCRICNREMVEIPSGTVLVWGTEEVRGEI
jgi:hypothetical protein